MRTKWVDLNIKEKLAILSAILSFILGWCMSIAGFWIPPIGEVADSILWILGQALLYAASVFGVSAYFRSETVQLRKDMDRHLEHMERLQIQREKIRNGIDVEEIPNNYNDEDNDKRRHCHTQCSQNGSREFSLFITDIRRTVNRNRPRRRLSNDSNVHHLVMGNPVFLFNADVLNNRKHRVSSAESKQPDFGECHK